jgi:hypothetical protein
MIGDWTNALHHLECSGETGAKLATRPWHQGLRWAMKNVEPHPIVHGELQLPMMMVVLLGVLLGLQQTIANVRKE